MRPAPRYSKVYNFIMSNFFYPKTGSPSASPAIGCIGDWRESCPGHPHCQSRAMNRPGLSWSMQPG